METPFKEIAVVLASYVLGCISTGYYLVRFRTGHDIRTLHSGSTGARNVGRVLGRTGFIVTLAGDLAKCEGQKEAFRVVADRITWLQASRTFSFTGVNATPRSRIT